MDQWSARMACTAKEFVFYSIRGQKVMKIGDFFVDPFHLSWAIRSTKTYNTRLVHSKIRRNLGKCLQTSAKMLSYVITEYLDTSHLTKSNVFLPEIWLPEKRKVDHVRPLKVCRISCPVTHWADCDRFIRPSQLFRGKRVIHSAFKRNVHNFPQLFPIPTCMRLRLNMRDDVKSLIKVNQKEFF